jgi:hypothetical protein
LGGHDERVRELLKQLEAKDNKVLNGYWLALLYAEMGKTDEALSQLEQLYETHDARLVHIKSDPRLNTLRDELRSRDLLRKMNLN